MMWCPPKKMPPPVMKKEKKMYRQYRIHYRYFVGSIIYLLSTRVDLFVAVHKLARF